MPLSREKLRGVLRAVRKDELGLTQRAFATRLGVTVITVQNYESGRYRPDPVVLRRVADLSQRHRAELEEELPEELRRGQHSKGRRPDETRTVLHTALDLVMENAPAEIRRKVAADLTRYAGQYGDEK